MDAGSAIFCPVVADQSISRWAVLGREGVAPALWGGGPSTSWSGGRAGPGGSLGPGSGWGTSSCYPSFPHISNFLSSSYFVWGLAVRLQLPIFPFLGVFRVCMRVFVLCSGLSSNCNQWFATSVASGWVGG